jgi:transcriptional regulator with XRE-family HTH domain
VMPREHRTPGRLRLAARLRELREATGQSAEAFGTARGWSQSKVSKIENARTVPSPEDVETWALATGAGAELAADLVQLAEDVGTETRRWAGRRHGTLAARSEEAGLAEAAATTVRVFQCAVIPGLLQTADYARQVITLIGTADEADIAADVNVRMQRQDALYVPGKQFEFVLTEGALRWRPGTEAMMAAQLARIARTAAEPTVDIRVLPYAIQAPALYTDGFTIYEIPDEPYALVETRRGEQFYREERDVDAFRKDLERCKEAALAGDEAVGMVLDLRRELTPD